MNFRARLSFREAAVLPFLVFLAVMPAACERDTGVSDAGEAAGVVDRVADVKTAPEADAGPESPPGSPDVESLVQRGRMVYLLCRSCHSLDAGGSHLVGPNLHGIVGAPAAEKAGFSYSRALTDAGLVWTEDVLDAWLARPADLVPGNDMVFAGLSSERDREAVIAYMRSNGP